MPLSEITTAISSIKTAFDIIKGINSLDIDVKVKEKTSMLYGSLISVQSAMLNLQMEYQTLSDEKRELQKRIEDFAKWDIIESQYKLYKTTIGTYVMAVTEHHPNPKPFHWLCPNCFENKIKSVLQKSHWEVDAPLNCPNCKTEIYLGRVEEDQIRGDAE